MKTSRKIQNTTLAKRGKNNATTNYWHQLGKKILKNERNEQEGKQNTDILPASHKLKRTEHTKIENIVRQANQNTRKICTNKQQ